jgi:short-subunit dehydrogenase
MTTRLRRLDEQVMVVTGASSGIGLATARLAAERGARVVLVSRDEEALAQAAAGLRDRGGSVMSLAADVADAPALERVAERAQREFGHLDTWVNNAGVGLYGRIEELPLADQRRLFDTNFWGVVHGCRAALPYLRRNGGVIVNVGSMLSDMTIPLQGIYSASKHAVKAYTEALRLELDRERAPVAVSLVLPAAIATPFFEHAGNYLDVRPQPVPPVYAPEAVARAILHCAERPRRTVRVGAPALVGPALRAHAPGAVDEVLERTMVEAQRSDRPARRGDDGGLYEPVADGARERADYDGRVRERSVYTSAALHPGRAALATLALVGLGAAAAAGFRSRFRER